MRHAVARALVLAAKKHALLAPEVRDAFAASVVASLEAEWDGIAAEGDEYARDALRLAARAGAERCEVLIERCPKGWKRGLRKALDQAV